jgi:CHASE2 domain-containing sensor protein
MFFGRDHQRDLIVANMLSSRLTILYGPSGIGKTSVICAGVVHALRDPDAGISAAEHSAVVRVAEWHSEPRLAVVAALEAEERRLTGGAAPDDGAGKTLDEIVASWTKRLDRQLLLVLDQYEQYLVNNPPGQDGGFDRGLADVVARSDVRARCLISLREDALGGLSRYEGMIPSLFGNRLRLEGFTEGAALEAIGRPVDRYNQLRGKEEPEMRLEPGLAEKVVRELRGGGSQLARGRGLSPGSERVASSRPIEPAEVQLVMQELWTRECASGSTLVRRQTLAEMGGCEQIVGSYVDDSLTALPSRQRALFARIVRYLVTPSGVKVAHSASDLAAYVESSQEPVAQMLERLTALGLMRRLPPPPGSAEPRYEVLHDLLAEPMLDWGSRVDVQRLRSRVRWLLAALSAAVAAVLAIAAYTAHPAALRHLELSTIDARFAVRGKTAPDRGVVIVDDDTRTLGALNHGQVSLRLRPYYAKLIDLLAADGARAIVSDIEFAKRGDEGQLLAAIKRAHGRVVLVAERFDTEGEVPLFGREGFGGSGPLLSSLGARPSFGGLPLDVHGVYRWLSYTAPYSHLHSLSVVAAEVAGGRPIASFSGPALIDYHGPPRTYTTVSMIDVLRGLVPASRFAGKIVLIGTSAPNGNDLHRTPFADRMPGVEIQANAISTVRGGLTLRTAGALTVVLVIVGFSLISLLAAPFRGWLALAIFVLAFVVCLVLVQSLFDGGVYLPAVYPLLALAIAALGSAVARALTLGQTRFRRVDRRGGAARPSSSGVPPGERTREDTLVA